MINNMKTAPKNGEMLTIHRRNKESGVEDKYRARWVLDPTSFFRPTTPGWQTMDGKWIEFTFVELIGWEY